MVTLNHRKEALSAAYIQAVAAKAGVSISVRALDYGVDGDFNAVSLIEGRLQELGFSIRYQAKASKKWQIDQTDGLIKYRLEGKTYNTMIRRNRSDSNSEPLLLLLLCLPELEEEWVSISDTELLLRRCCYYHYVRGEEPISSDLKKQIGIPAQQVFTPEVLTDLLERKKQGEDL